MNQTSKFSVLIGLGYGNNSYSTSISFTSDHKLVLDYEGQRKEISGIADENMIPMQVGPGSNVTTRMHIEIDADEFDRLTSLDYTQATDDIAQHIGEGRDDDTAPAPTAQAARNFRLDLSKVDCSIQFNAALKPLVD